MRFEYIYLCLQLMFNLYNFKQYLQQLDLLIIQQEMCVLNTTLNGCRTILPFCNLYTTQQLCDYALITSNTYCYWNGSSCINAQCLRYQYHFQYHVNNLVNVIQQEALVEIKRNYMQFNQRFIIKHFCLDQQYLYYQDLFQLSIQYFHHMNCSQWQKSCTVNQKQNQCINIIDCTTAPQEINTINQCEQLISQY
ncbi:unnamed protein product [Paramecium primaurelia]|uniref:Uncharacterized protein n=1 Tax=Paramecium primaurelia TaxID=5886 RepID=A0A8S1QMM6_PARPR|nr:unnamed protein product [Paramecium primaurelia]